jgi:hypothetical protein
VPLPARSSSRRKWAACITLGGRLKTGNLSTGQNRQFISGGRDQ